MIWQEREEFPSNVLMGLVVLFLLKILLLDSCLSFAVGPEPESRWIVHLHSRVRSYTIFVLCQTKCLKADFSKT